MDVRKEWRQHRSPLISTMDMTAYGAPLVPAHHTAAELTTLVGLLTEQGKRIGTVAVGHSRDEPSRAAAEAFTVTWESCGGTVLTVVDWPESAASWLRPAVRLTAALPDAWVMAAAPLGFAQLARRLRHSTDWDPARTYAFAALGDPGLPALAGDRTLHGLRGATADGGSWEVDHHSVTVFPPAAESGRTP
ncbi:hypothetical protein [Streptomyces nitrosporeus]|uniref:hypothetical protein n=1 Tax=Streptomyces nitrosporeus TaxID=28894 RepID=UPI00332DD2C9